MLIVRILCSGLGFILADEKRTSKIQIVHQYRAIVMWMWQSIYLSTSTEKQEYSQFHAFRLCIIRLLCLTFTPSICGTEAETTPKQSSVVYLLQSSGKKCSAKKGAFSFVWILRVRCTSLVMLHFLPGGAVVCLCFILVLTSVFSSSYCPDHGYSHQFHSWFGGEPSKGSI